MTPSAPVRHAPLVIGASPSLLGRALGVASVVTFYAALGQYAFASGLSPLPDLAWIVAVGGLALATLLVSWDHFSDWITSPTTLWSAGYFVVSVLGFLVPVATPDTFPILRLRIITTLFLAIM